MSVQCRWLGPVIFQRPSCGWAAATVILMTSSLVDYPLRTPLLSAVFAVACVEMARAAKRSAELRQRAGSVLSPAAA